MLRLHIVCALLGLVAAGLLLTPVYAAPFFLGGALDGGGPGASPPGSRWFTDFDTVACDQSLSGESINEVHLDDAHIRRSSQHDRRGHHGANQLANEPRF